MREICKVQLEEGTKEVKERKNSKTRIWINKRNRGVISIGREGREKARKNRSKIERRVIVESG
jgi:hypothetical protein